MRLFVELDGRWIQLDHITHIGPIDHPLQDCHIPPGTRSYLALSTNKYLYLPYAPETVVAMLEDRASCDGFPGRS